jgi:hypothetical protein
MAKQEKYLPETRLTEPKSTPGEEFVIMGTSDGYRGNYIETFDGKYYAGNSLSLNGVELEKVGILGAKEDNLIGGVTTVASPLLLSILQKLFKKKPTPQELQKGVAKRYFIQDKKNNKIVETDKETYILAQKEVPNRKFAEADWVIKGPAEDQVLNGYPFEGAISKNKKTIEKLEMQIPGILTYVTDYKFLVTEPILPNRGSTLPTETYTEQDPLRELENSRKANFDLRK